MKPVAARPLDGADAGMLAGMLERVLRRDRLIVASALGAITLLAWAYLFWLAVKTDHDGLGLSALCLAPAGTAWGAVEFATMFTMWVVMMVGMMTPAAAPMLLMQARIGRQGGTAGNPLAATGWFAAGYFLAWAGFALAATLAQWALEQGGPFDPRLARVGNPLGAAVLIAAGLYQWTPLKDFCLVRCQTPFAFLMRHGGFRRDGPGSLALGLRHGAYCIGCCWLLMALLFVVGVMNLLWNALLTLLLLLEKLTPWGRWVARAAGAGCVAAGVWMTM